MLKWPEKARRSIATFFIKWNDFDVYVEDTAKHANSIYVEFISRMAGGNCKIGRIVPLGDRAKVINSAIADTRKDGRPRLYLVDGDLDLIAGIPNPPIPRLYVHKVYHLENYLVCEDALTIVLHEENPKFSATEIRAKLDFANWGVETMPLLYLFCVFGVTRILDPSLPTISLGIGSFTTKMKIDQSKITAFCSARMADLENRFSALDVDAAKHKIDSSKDSIFPYLDLISAREFLIPVLRAWIAKQGLQLPASKESLLFRLSKYCSLERHAELKKSIQECATK